MAKEKTLFFCKECGCESPRWYGQCPACKEWNTIVEASSSMTKIMKSASSSVGSGTFSNLISTKPSYISDISLDESDRYETGLKEFDRVLGGGIVAGSLVLIGGDPGIGKSTILLQMCINLAKSVQVLLKS